MEEGTILSWYKKEGEPVQVGEPILSVETDKVAIDVEAPASGVMLKIVCQEGVTVPLSETIAWVGAPGETLPGEIAPQQIVASPIAKRLASQHGIDLSRVAGSGPNGRIVEADIQSLLQARQTEQNPQADAAQPSFTMLKMNSTRKTTSQRISESWRSIPHFHLTVEIDASALVKLHDSMFTRFDSEFSVHLTYTDLLIKALARALTDHPLMNAAYFDPTEIKLYSEINVGVAVSTDRGLITGVVHQSNKLTFWQISQRRQELVARAQAHQLTLKDVSGGTFTLTNLGMFGVQMFTPIIYPDQSAMLAVGAIYDKLVMDGGQASAQPIVKLTLAVDHRVADGSDGARFLSDLAHYLQKPDILLD